MHDGAFLFCHAGENAFAQGAECVVVHAQTRQKVRPVHDALTERTVLPFAFAVKYAVLDMQHADFFAEAGERAFQNLYLGFRGGRLRRDQVRRIQNDAQALH